MSVSQNKTQTNITTNRNNNITTRLNKATQNVKNEMASPGNSILNKLTGFTNSFKNVFSAGQNNSASNATTNNKARTNKTNMSPATQNNKLDNPFNNPIMLWSLILITLGFMAYGLYYYYTSTSSIQQGTSYYGDDLLNYSPVFKLNTERIDSCIKRCESDPLCDGITFNRDELTCIGTKRGILRDDGDSLSAWVKPANSQSSNTFNKSVILVGLAKENVTISADKISYPGNPYEFNWSMYLYLNDHLANHGSWRQILHKGSELTDQIDTPNWEDILSQIPDQSVGIWMSPFNNNLRIALTTVTQSKKIMIVSQHAHVDAASGTLNQEPISNIPEKNIEFFDIYQFPVKKIKHLSVNVLSSSIEIYLDGMIYKVFSLTGRPEFNRGNLYIMKPKTVDGYIQKLSYAPAPLKITDIRALLQK